MVVAGTAAVVTVASWLAAITYDAGQLEVDSFVAGQRWAQLTMPSATECEIEMFRISGPKVNGMAWLDGCLASDAFASREDAPAAR